MSQFEVRYGHNPIWLGQVIDIYNKAGMPRTNPKQVERAFSNSQVVVSIWTENRLVALGRMLTDFEMYASIFDVAVDRCIKPIQILR